MRLTRRIGAKEGSTSAATRDSGAPAGVNITTGKEAARTNAKCNSGTGVKGNSTRHARCRRSVRRAAKLRFSNGLWAARSKHNNGKLKHEDIMSMMERRSHERRKARVNDEDVQWWVEEENYERDRGAEMQQMDVMLLESMEPTVIHPSHGSVPE
jgi:hypothetical protein